MLIMWQPGEPRRRAQAEKMPTGRREGTAQNGFAGNTWVQSPPFTPEAGMDQNLAVKQGRSLLLQRPKGGDTERLGWVHVEGAVHWLAQLPFQAHPGDHPTVHTSYENYFPCPFASRSSEEISLRPSDVLVRDLGLEPRHEGFTWLAQVMAQAAGSAGGSTACPTGVSQS